MYIAQHSGRVDFEQLTGRGNILFERWMDSVYVNSLNDVPWKKLFSWKRKAEIVQVNDDFLISHSCFYFIRLQRQQKMLPLHFSLQKKG